MIATAISFCTNDWRFLRACVEGVRPFSSQILITVCDHFFDGKEENYGLLEEAFSQFPDVSFLLFAFDPQKSYRYASPLYPEHVDWRHEWHNTGRFLSYYHSASYENYLFFVDCDEIVDGERFARWFAEEPKESLSAWRFSGYRHFRKAQYVANEAECLGLLVKRQALKPEWLWDVDERMGLFHRLIGKKELAAMGREGLPLIRHFSGVRTPQEFQRKCASWGHHWERDWASLIDREFSSPFSGRDFVRNYTYRKEAIAFDPLQVDIPNVQAKSLEQFRKDVHHFPHVICVDSSELFKRQLHDEFL